MGDAHDWAATAGGPAKQELRQTFGELAKARFKLAGRRRRPTMATMKALKYAGVAAAVLAAGSARADLVSAVQVVVNQEVITSGQIVGLVTSALPAPDTTDPQKWAQEVDKTKDTVVQSLVERDLILHAFMAEGYQTNLLESFVDDYIQDNVKKIYYGDRSRLLKTLRDEGITYEEYRRDQRDKIIADYMNHQNAPSKKVIISPLQIENYYNTHQDEFKVTDQVKLRMIGIQPDDSGPESARAVADEVLKKIDSGVDFTEMATVYSAGTHRAEGGERGWVERSYLAPELSEAAFTLKPGQHSGVIQLKNGFCYILLVEDARKAHVKPLTEVRDDIERTLSDREAKRLRDRWIQRMRAKSYVRYY